MPVFPEKKDGADDASQTPKTNDSVLEVSTDHKSALTGTASAVRCGTSMAEMNDERFK